MKIKAVRWLLYVAIKSKNCSRKKNSGQACKKAIFLIDSDFNCYDIYWNDSY